MKNHAVLAAAILSVRVLLIGCSGDEVRPDEMTGEESSKDVFQAARPRYSQEQFKGIFLKALNQKNDKAVEHVNVTFHTMMEGIDKPGFSCRHSAESAQAYLSGARTEFGDVTGPDGDMLKEAWTQFRSELGPAELGALKSWMSQEAKKLIEPQLEMGFSGSDASNFARFLQACPDHFQTIIDELTNFMKATDRWLEVFSPESTGGGASPG